MDLPLLKLTQIVFVKFMVSQLTHVGHDPPQAVHSPQSAFLPTYVALLPLSKLVKVELGRLFHIFLTVDCLASVSLPMWALG